MPTYNVNIDGKDYRVEGVSTPEEAYAQAQSFLSGAPGKAGGQLTTEERLARIESLQAEREELAAQPKPDVAKATVEATAVGVGAGLTNTVLGVGKGIADAAHAVFGVGEGAAQHIEGFQDAVRQKAGEMTAEIAAETFEDITPEGLEEFKALGEQSTDRAKMGGDILVGIGAGGATAALKSGKAILAAGTAEGALAGWLFGGQEGQDIDQRVADRIGDMKLGAAFGAGFGLLPALMAGTKNVFNKVVRNAADDIEEGQELQREFGVSLTLGQKSGAPTIQKIEKDAAGNIAQRFFAEQKTRLATSIGSKLGVILKPFDKVGTGQSGPIREAADKISRALGKQKQIRAEEFRVSLKEADDVAGGQGIVQLDEAAEEAKRIIGELNSSMHGAEMLQTGAARTLTQIAEGKPVSAAQLNDWQSQLNRWRKDGKNFFKDTEYVGFERTGQSFASSLNRLIKKGIATAQPATPQAKRALDMVKAARQSYGEANATIRQVEDEVLGALGLKGVDNVQDIMKNLREADPVQVRAAMKIVDEMDGASTVRKELVENLYEDAVNQGLVGARAKGGATGDIDVPAFAKALGANSRRSVFMGLVDSETNKRVNRGLALTRKILNDTSQYAPTGIMKTVLPWDLSSLSINALTLNPGFTARLLAGAVSRGKGADWLFHSKEGIKVLETLADRTVKGTKSAVARNMAIMTLLGIQADGRADEKVEQQQQP